MLVWEDGVVLSGKNMRFTLCMSMVLWVSLCGRLVRGLGINHLGVVKGVFV